MRSLTHGTDDRSSVVDHHGKRSKHDIVSNALEASLQDGVVEANRRTEPEREPAGFGHDIADAIGKYHTDCARYVREIASELKNLLESVIKQCEVMADELDREGLAKGTLISEAVSKAKTAVEDIKKVKEQFNGKIFRGGDTVHRFDALGRIADKPGDSVGQAAKLHSD